MQIEIAQRPAFAVARAAGWERRGETGSAADRAWQRRPVRKQHRADQALGRAFDADAIVRRRPRGEPGSRDQVVDVRLMSEDQQGHSVAVRRQVRRGIESRAQIGHRAARREMRFGQVALHVPHLALQRRGHRVAQMRRGNRAGDEPSTPSLGNRCVIGGQARVRRHRVAVPIDDRRAHDEAGNAAGGLRLMALQTGAGLARDDRLVARLLIDGVEHRAEVRIDRRDLHDRPALHPPDVHIVAEIDRARGPRRDVIDLEAGPREHQPLRGHRHLQRAEQRRQVAMRLVELQRGFAGIDRLLQTRDGVSGGGFRVGDGGVFGEWSCSLRQPESGQRRDENG